MTKYVTILCVSGLLLATACSHTKDKEEDKRPVEVLYNEALTTLKKEKYRKAVEQFEDLERTYPYSKWATNAQLMTAYAHYEDEQYDDAIIALERFIKLHPGHQDVAYAYYLKSLCYYERISTITRDQSFTEQSEKALKEVTVRFPDSDYARDAAIKLDLVQDHLAGKEVEVGRFYLTKGQYIAAINRFQKVLENYQTTSQIPEALHRLVEAYTALGIPSEAQHYAAVLGHNYPGSTWYSYSYALVGGQEEPQAKAGAGDVQKPVKESWFHIPFLGDKKRQLAPPPSSITDKDASPVTP